VAPTRISRLQLLIGWGVLALVAIMPLHAFLATWLGASLGHHTLWLAWKEILIVCLGVGSLVLFWKQPEARLRLHRPINYAIAAFIIISLLVTAFIHPRWAAAISGLKIDCEFLVVFVIAQLAASRVLKLRAGRALIVSSSLVIGFGLLQILFLPNDFLKNFGYGPQTIEPFLTVPGIASVRILSTLGGPNQLGEFLIIPICLVLGWMIRRPRWWQPLFLLAAAVVEWRTYSRSAWLGLGLGALVVLGVQIGSRKVWAIAAGLALVAALIIGFLLSAHNGARTSLVIKDYLYHGDVANLSQRNSSREHLSASALGLQVAEHHPLGEGLGSSGPASYQSQHPQIPENYYLQVAIESGFLGLAAFVLVISLLGNDLWQLGSVDGSRSGLLGALIGLSIVNFFLHGWADSTTALVYWSYAGLVVGARA
jgi:hypothetical protein